MHKKCAVCTAWREICKDPAMWRVVRMYMYTGVARDICKHAVDRSQGQLLHVTIIGYCDEDLLQYVADRSSQLRRLEIAHGMCFEFHEKWSEAFKKISLLEEFRLQDTRVSRKDIEAAGRWCPLLKTLKLNQKISFWDDDESTGNDIALAIGKNLPELTHLELTGSNMTNIGLQAILDGCRHLESLDLRQCLNVHLEEDDLGKRCSQQIKHLKLPLDSLEDCSYIDDEYDEYVGYDDYRSYDSLEMDDEYNQDMDYDDHAAYDTLNFESLSMFE